MAKILHQLMKTDEKVCQVCAQLFEGECRAFSMPQSDQEKAQRLVMPVPLCVWLATVESREREAGHLLSPDELKDLAYRYLEREIRYNTVVLSPDEMNQALDRMINVVHQIKGE